MLKRIKNKQRKLGNYEKQLIIKLLKRRVGYYDVVLARKKAKPSSRLFKFGFYQVVRNSREQFSLLSLDFLKISELLSSKLVKLDTSFLKVIC